MKIDHSLTVLMFCAIVAGIAIMLVLVLVPWPDAFAEWGARENGNLSFVETLSAVITATGALAAVATFGATTIYSSRTLRRTVDNDSASRFQAAAQLIADSRQSSNVAGLALMEQVVDTFPRYATPAIRTISHHLLETDGDAKVANPHFIEGLPPFVASWPISRLEGAETLSSLGRLVHKHWPKSTDLIDGEGRFWVAEPYLADKFFDGDDFSRFNFSRGIWNSVIFTSCDFTDANFFVVAGHRIQMNHCDLTRATIRIGPSAKITYSAHHRGAFEIKNPAGVEGAVVNGMPIETWLEMARLSERN